MIPKTLAVNAGFDAQETIVKLVEERIATGLPVGLDLTSGEPFSPEVTVYF